MSVGDKTVRTANRNFDSVKISHPLKESTKLLIMPTTIRARPAPIHAVVYRGACGMINTAFVVVIITIAAMVAYEGKRPYSPGVGALVWETMRKEWFGNNAIAV